MKKLLALYPPLLASHCSPQPLTGRKQRGVGKHRADVPITAHLLSLWANTRVPHCVAPNYIPYGRQVSDKLLSDSHIDTDGKLSEITSSYSTVTTVAVKVNEAP